MPLKLRAGASITIPGLIGVALIAIGIRTDRSVEICLLLRVYFSPIAIRDQWSMAGNTRQT
jgi:hypothetical protein